MAQGDLEHSQNIDSTGVELPLNSCQLPGIKTRDEERTKEDNIVQNNKV